MAIREVNEYMTRWWKNDNTGDVSVGYDVDGRTKWSAIQVNSVSELGTLVDLLRTEEHVIFDDEENCLRTSTLHFAGGIPIAEGSARQGQPSPAERSSRSATDPTDPRWLRRSENRDPARRGRH